jgi:hypothetical protein
MDPLKASFDLIPLWYTAYNVFTALSRSKRFTYFVRHHIHARRLHAPDAGRPRAQVDDSLTGPVLSRPPLSLSLSVWYSLICVLAIIWYTTTTE